MVIGRVGSSITFHEISPSSRASLSNRISALFVVNVFGVLRRDTPARHAPILAAILQRRIIEQPIVNLASSQRPIGSIVIDDLRDSI
jgi:hypothetical protein